MQESEWDENRDYDEDWDEDEDDWYEYEDDLDEERWAYAEWLDQLPAWRQWLVRHWNIGKYALAHPLSYIRYVKAGYDDIPF